MVTSSAYTAANHLIQRYDLQKEVVATVEYRTHDFPEPEYKDNVVFEMWYRFDVGTVEIHNIVLEYEYRGQGFFKHFISKLQIHFSAIKIVDVVNERLAAYLKTISTEYEKGSYNITGRD